MELVRPKLDEMRPQWQMTSAMVVGMAQSTLEMDTNLDPIEKEQMRKFVGAMTQIVQTTDFMSEELAEKAIGVLCRTARPGCPRWTGTPGRRRSHRRRDAEGFVDRSRHSAGSSTDLPPHTLSGGLGYAIF